MLPIQFDNEPDNNNKQKSGKNKHLFLPLFVKVKLFLLCAWFYQTQLCF